MRARRLGLYGDETNAVWVVSAALNRILEYSHDGMLQYYWGAYGGTRGRDCFTTPAVSSPLSDLAFS
jgi:hypothetical protein